MGRRSLVSAAALATLALAGCGGSPGHTGSGSVSVGAYGVTPATTVSGPANASASACRRHARTLAADAVGFVDHYGSAAAYPADLNYVIIREDLARLQTAGCDPMLLGRALTARLTAAQRRTLVDNLPAAMADEIRAALARA
ncbi:MAG TPA: hypothetical protein VH816_00595 [Gaiellaceae bacterium]|jgi:hypothetical protein